MNEADLLEAIAREPGSVERYLVYADWLAQRGDPRGELIAVQAELSRAPGDRRLVMAEQDLLHEHRERLLGPCAVLAAHGVLAIDWRWGFIIRARFEGDYDPERHGTIFGRLRRDELLEALLAQPAARMIERIEIGDWWVERDRMFDVESTVLARAPKTLRSLTIAPRGERGIGGRLLELEGLLSAQPQLAELELAGESVLLRPQFDPPRLERLVILEHRPSEETVASIVGKEWPSLASLAFVSSGHPYFIIQSEIGLVFSPERFPTLESLSLRGALHASWPVVAELAAAPILGQLRRLDLSRCHLDDFGAHALVRRAGAFAKLEQLNLDGNELTDDGVEAVRQLGCEVIIGSQRGIHYE